MCSTHIAAPPEQVFAIVGDLGRTVEWSGSGHIRSIQQLDTLPAGVGTKYRSSEKITMSYTAMTEIVAYEPNRLIRWISKPWGEPVPYHRWEFRLDPDGEGTRLTHEVRAARSTGLMSLVQRLGFLFTRPERTIATGMDRTLHRVMELAEANSRS